MKYLGKSFSVGSGNSVAYRDSWERIFRPHKVEAVGNQIFKCSCGEEFVSTKFVVHCPKAS